MRSLVILVVLVLSAPGPCRADPCQVARLLAPEPYAPTSFGNSIARSGDYWFIADYRAQVLCTGFGCGAGAVYVYRMVEGELVYVQTLTSPFPQLADNYGFAIASHDGRVAISSRYGGLPDRSDRPGIVYVYALDDGAWIEQATIEPLADSYEFGTSMAFSQGTLAVSDFDKDRVLAYVQDAEGEWDLVSEILAPTDVSPNSWFGIAVAVTDEFVVVGAPFDRSRITNGGSVHFYRRIPNGSYTLAQSVYADAADRLGWAIDSSDDSVFVGAPIASRAFEEQGVVYEFTNDSSGWEVRTEIESETPGRRHDFGSLVLAEDGQLLVTAAGDGRGSVQQFDDPSGSWRQLSRVVTKTSTRPVRFGASLARDGQVLLVGAPDESDTAGSPVYGAAYHFDLSCGSCEVDLDADGTLTIFDFLAFLNLFEDGEAAADFDGDGELTIFDFLAFQTAFDAGCE